MVLAQCAPAWELENQQMEIVQFRGATSPYIEPPRGQPTWSLMKMLHPDLSADVRVLVHSTLKEGKTFKKNNVKFKVGKLIHLVDLVATPVFPSGHEGHCLLLFAGHDQEENGILQKKLGSKKTKEGKVNFLESEVTTLQDELALTQKSLQAIIEDQNATSEEMQSANEEVMSANEELQSTNEELETAKEELQSTNEELTTLNDELSSRNADLDRISNDLLNLLSNANVSIVMVGVDLRIKRFTPMAEKLLQLIPADIGRSLTQINLGFKVDYLAGKISEVIREMLTIEVETQDRDGHWYSVRIRPYKTVGHKIDGAVLVFINSDEGRARERLAQAADAYSDGIIQTVRDPLIVLDEGLRVERVNQAFYDTFKVKREETLGRLFYELGNHQWDIPELRDLLENVLPKKLEVRDFEVSHHFDVVGEKTIVVHARRLEWEGQKKLLMLITLHDHSGGN
jgi:two-component system CheB/CheR fusion protein